MLLYVNTMAAVVTGLLSESLQAAVSNNTLCLWGPKLVMINATIPFVAASNWTANILQVCFHNLALFKEHLQSPQSAHRGFKETLTAKSEVRVDLAAYAKVPVMTL